MLLFFVIVCLHQLWFFLQMLEKFAEDDRIEQMNAQKRRMKQLEHKKAVEKLIEDRRIQFQRERVRKIVSSDLTYLYTVTVLLCYRFVFLNVLFFLLQEAELEARREQERMEEYRRQIIERERQRLLKEHASKLLGFLPKVGVSSTTCAHVFHFSVLQDLGTHLTNYNPHENLTPLLRKTVTFSLPPSFCPIC